MSPRLIALVLAATAAGAGAAQHAELRDGVVRVEGAAPDAVLEVFVADADAPPPLLGSMRREDGAVVFEPRYPLAPGMRFRALYRATPDSAPVETLLETDPPPPRRATRVDGVYPTAGEVPENLLKLYVEFSAPMSSGQAWQRLRLLDDSGDPVEHAFLEIDQELWDPEGRRLTVLFDPGRVKRELRPNMEVGSPLREGRRYVLEVDAGWPDAAGQPLADAVRKTFRVGPPDHEPPSMDGWELVAPAPGTRAPFVVRFPEPLDRALLLSALSVEDATGEPLAGEAQTADGETAWQFVPAQPWRAGAYSLRAATVLEDLAGNSLERPFEVDVFERVQERVYEVTEAVRFEVR